MKTTKTIPFSALDPEGARHLFHVAPGIELLELIEQAEARLGAALGAITSAACCVDDDKTAAPLWSGVYALESVAGLLEAAQGVLIASNAEDAGLASKDAEGAD